MQGLCLSWLSLLSLAWPSLQLQAPEKERAAIEQGVIRDLGESPFTNTSTAARRFVISEQGQDLTLRMFDQQTLLETRALGPRGDSAVRLAVLLIVRAHERLVAQGPPKPPSKPPPPGPPPKPPPPPETVGTSTAPAQAPPKRWFLEGDLGVETWSAPVAPRTQASAAVLFGLAPVRLGLRLVVTGACCTLQGDALNADVWSIGGVVEAQYWALNLGRFGLGLVAAAGLVFDIVDALIVDIFEPAGPERSSTLSAFGRVGGQGTVALLNNLDLRVSIGAQLYSASPEIQLPAPYREGRTPLERGFITAYVEIGLIGAIF